MPNLKETVLNLVAQRTAEDVAKAATEAEKLQSALDLYKKQQISLEEKFVAEEESLNLSAQRSLFPLLEEAKDALSSMSPVLLINKPLTRSIPSQGPTVSYTESGENIDFVGIITDLGWAIEYKETKGGISRILKRHDLDHHKWEILSTKNGPEIFAELKWNPYPAYYSYGDEYSGSSGSYTAYGKSIQIAVQKDNGESVATFRTVKHKEEVPASSKTLSLKNGPAMENVLTSLITLLV